MNFLGKLANIFKRKSKTKGIDYSEKFKLKYYNFRELLNSNTEMARIIAETEELLRGNKFFGASHVRSVVAKATFHSLRMIEHLNVLSEDKYFNLYDVHRKICDCIKEITENRSKETKARWILPYNEITKELIDKVGAKNANLGEILNKLKLPIPRGFAITVEAYYYFIEQNDLRDEINKILMEVNFDNPASIEEASERIQEKIILAQVPQDLKEAILEAYDQLANEIGQKINIAVRSSAIGEDGDISFAGQYLSLLNVTREQIVKSYQYVIASLYTPRAIAYRFRMGIPDENCAMSVACIEMIDSVASGVCYSRNPVNPSINEITINASWGLGSYVVDGTVSPDTYTVTKDTETIRKIISSKTVKLTSNPYGGLIEVPVENEWVNKPCLTEEQIKTLARYSILLENHYGFPQDTEWALDPQGNIIILQTRPLRMTETLFEGSPIDIPDNLVPIIEEGTIANPGIGFGPAVLINSDEDFANFPPGGVLVIKHSSPRFVILMDKVSAIVSDAGSVTGHMASVAREFNVPTLLNTKIATKLIKPGDEILVDAYRGKIYKGTLSEDLKKAIEDLKPKKSLMKDTPVYDFLEKVSKYILPLNLIDPYSPNFLPENCKTFHDIMRFAHEKSYEEMFKISDLISDNTETAHELEAPIPINLYLIDLGGGLTEEASVKIKIPPSYVTSIPFRAFLRGMLDEAVNKPTPRPIEFSGFFSVLTEQILSNPYAMERFGDKSYAIIADKYLHFSSRVGYHFAILDCYCGATINKNYITFSFKGGAANDIRRNRRAQAIAKILKELNFTVNVTADCVEARIQKYDSTIIENSLEYIGRLLQFTRQMDMLMYNDHMIEIVAKAFLEGEYDLEEIVKKRKIYIYQQQ